MAEREHTFISMGDGVRLHATLYLPQGSGPWPALLEALPYRKDDLTASYRPEYERFAEHGYAVCRVDLRGTGTSEGVAEDEYPPVELRDLNEVIAWLASRRWCSGAVGMFGTSYSGFNSVQVAMTRPPALRAIVSIFATDDRYTYDDVHYYGGALKALDLIDYPAYMVAMNALPPVPSLYGQGWRAEWERRVTGSEPWLIRWLQEQNRSPYWDHGSLCTDYGSIRAATMIVAGWADGYWKDALHVLESLRCPKRLLQGPWAHASTETSLPGPNIDLFPEMVRWWDRWLKDEPNGVDRDPPIVWFARRSTRPEPDLSRMGGEWRFEPGWPLERSRRHELPLSGAATPGRVGPGPDELEVRGDVGWTAWISCAGHLPYGQPVDQRPDEPFSLVYDWPPLEDEVELFGRVRLDLTVSASAPVAYVSAKLCDVFPDGTSALVARGFLNLTHRHSHEHPEALEPGRPVRAQIDFLLTSWVFEAGHRLRLDLAGTDWPNVWSPPQPVTITVDRSASTLILPTLDGPSPLTERPALPPSGREQERPTPAPGSRGGGDERDGGVTWRIEHDVLERRTRAVAGSEAWTEAEGDRPRMFEGYGGWVEVSTTDPGQARARSRTRLIVEWPEATVEAEARQVVRSDAHAYHLELELDVREDGQTRWSRRWEHRFPRDLQ
ncbi:MAG TPA: CocE/NonD family hydrolase [Actinomycetota bacterium]|nr:CocE/NonD family hydrolase [Actinomycetota bacterium]